MEISFWKTVGCLIKKHLIMFLRAARHLHPLAVRGAAEPMAHGQRRGSAHGRGLGAPDAGRSGPSAVHAQVAAWAEARNAAQTGIDWPFRTADARVRFKKLYPTIET